MYLGMRASDGTALGDIDHIRQSVSDILNTPVGSRVMRRDYGSLLSTLIDAPANDALRLQLMSATYGAIMRWEPRVVVKALSLSPSGVPGQYTADLSCTRSDGDATFTFAVRVRKTP